MYFVAISVRSRYFQEYFFVTTDSIKVKIFLNDSSSNTSVSPSMKSDFFCVQSLPRLAVAALSLNSCTFFSWLKEKMNFFYDRFFFSPLAVTRTKQIKWKRKDRCKIEREENSNCNGSDKVNYACTSIFCIRKYHISCVSSHAASICLTLCTKETQVSN